MAGSVDHVRRGKFKQRPKPHCFANHLLYSRESLFIHHLNRCFDNRFGDENRL